MQSVSLHFRSVGSFLSLPLPPPKLSRFRNFSGDSNLRRLHRKTVIAAAGNEFSDSSQGIEFGGEEFVSNLLNRKWTLPNPDTKLNKVFFSNSDINLEYSPANLAVECSGNAALRTNYRERSFYVVRDDLLHPLVNGNKARKLDGILPLIEDHLVTDVVTCGGCQSAHAAATERGLRSHLLLRGEQPEILTGYNLISTIYGNVKYVPRSIYTNRENMLKSQADLVAGSSGCVVWFDDIFPASSKKQPCFPSNFVQTGSHWGATKQGRKVIVLNEGAGDTVALLGLIRLVKYLSEDHLLGKQRTVKFVVDAGTGTTAIGLGLGALCLGLPWEVTAVMLADRVDGYKRQEKHLISEFKKHFGYPDDQGKDEVSGAGGIVNWVERFRPRKFGNVLDGELATCKQIAQTTGILVDPIYTLAAWEMATHLSQKGAQSNADVVVLLHTGGTLGMFGLAQRYKSYFNDLKDVFPFKQQ